VLIYRSANAIFGYLEQQLRDQRGGIGGHFYKISKFILCAFFRPMIYNRLLVCCLHCTCTVCDVSVFTLFLLVTLSFCRSYYYTVTVWSAIGTILSSVRPSSVSLSLCLSAVHCQGWCKGSKLYQHVLSRHVPICPFRHFCFIV